MRPAVLPRSRCPPSQRDPSTTPRRPGLDAPGPDHEPHGGGIRSARSGMRPSPRTWRSTNPERATEVVTSRSTRRRVRSSPRRSGATGPNTWISYKDFTAPITARPGLRALRRGTCALYRTAACRHGPDADRTLRGVALDGTTSRRRRARTFRLHSARRQRCSKRSSSSLTSRPTARGQAVASSRACELNGFDRRDLCLRRSSRMAAGRHVLGGTGPAAVYWTDCWWRTVCARDELQARTTRGCDDRWGLETGQPAGELGRTGDAGTLLERSVAVHPRTTTPSGRGPATLTLAARVRRARTSRRRAGTSEGMRRFPAGIHMSPF